MLKYFHRIKNEQEISMIKAIFFDVDGTLLSHDTKQVPLSTKCSLKRLQERGIKIFISTGRHPMELQHLPLHDIRFDGYITLNGQLVSDRTGKRLFHIPFPPDIAATMIRLFHERDLPLALVGEERFIINFVDDSVRKVQASISSPIPPVLPYDGFSIYQVWAYLRRGEEHRLKNRLPGGCKMTRWCDDAVDLIQENGGKVEGIKRMLEYHGIARNEIMAFGDAENDIDMLQFAEIGIAMGNASGPAKAVADFVTAHIDEDGIAEGLRHFSLL